MFAYFVRSTYDAYHGMLSIKLEVGQHWPTFEPGTAAIWVHPDIDFHEVQGDLLLRGKTAKLMECPPNYRIKESGIFILAHSYSNALELLRP
ncbi:gp4 [Shigella virus Moo19]|uniref:Uncharacterized protein n=1 Tax=Shigella virus Moo19 TaxID=2886042 RepID=A0AAE8YCK5_9CAUD|nr:gp4 [Shigella virus Moo19]UEN68800.1 hypothetical protein Moo19_gp4 [Shigella virus Moo19]